MVPVFITVDPERDTVEQVREYVKGKFLNDFHMFIFFCSKQEIISLKEL